MMDVFPKQSDCHLRKSKSMCSLTEDGALMSQALHKEHSFCGYGVRSRTASDSSVDVFVVNDTDSEASGDGPVRAELEAEALAGLEQKIDRLSDIFLEQCQILSSIKNEIQESRDAIEKTSYQLLNDVVTKTITQRVRDVSAERGVCEQDSNSRARSLLDALEVKRACSLDRDIREALTAFLQSDELRARIASATAASVREVVRGGVRREVRAACLASLERAQRRLLRHVTATLEEAFADLGECSTQLSKQMFRASCNLRRSLERRAGLDAPRRPAPDALRRTVEELLDKELKQWRQQLLEMLIGGGEAEAGRTESPPPDPPSPVSPRQPAHPEMSIIDQLMKSAEINKQISDGDVNGAFERALSAGDLALVTAACRAADPALLFAPPAPCALAPPVLLALAQQLATDMVHDTQLKCRYLEDAIISLDRSNPATKSHLPTVVSEIRKHLMKFLLSYPNHVASRRVTLIVMAADNLLKHCT